MINLIPFEKRFNSLFDDLLEVSPLRSAMNVQTQEDKFLIILDVPGMTKEDLILESREGSLMVKGSKEVHGQKRSVYQHISIPKGVDLDQAEAVVENGILTITLPKSVSQKSRTILIK